MEIFTSLTPYHWIALGLILLMAEMLGAAGFLLGAAAAAFGMAVFSWLLPETSVFMQLVAYAAGATVLTLVYFQLFRDGQREPARPLLNKRARRLVGHQFHLEDDLQLGSTKVQIGDTMWTIESDTPIAKGTLVEVIDTNRMSLVVSAK